MPYTPTTWVDGSTPVDAANLNKIEAGIADAVAADEQVAAGTAILANKTTGGDANNRMRIMGDGKYEWGAGGASALDVDLYRHAADVLRTTDQFVADGGITTKTKAGVPTDADTAHDADGTFIVDTTNSRVYVRVGGAWVYVPVSATGGPLIYRKNTSRTVNSTVSATDLLNGEITIAANALTSTGILRLTAWGDWLQNSGGTSAPPRLQLVLGGTTLIDTGAPSAPVSASATRGGWNIEAIISAVNATNVQAVSWRHWLASGAVGYNAGATSTIVGFTTGVGNYTSVPSHANTSNSDGGQWQAVGYNAGAKDMTASQALVINVINGSSSANYETRLFGALVEIL